MNIRRLGIGLGALVLAAAASMQPAGAASPRSESAVYYWNTVDEVDGAGAALTRTTNGLSFVMRTSDTAGDADTVWWVIFNNPEACSGGCGPDEVMASFGGTNPWDLAILNADGRVVPPTGDVTFSGQLSIGSDGPGETLYGNGVTDPVGALVILVVVNHGEASDDRETRWEQTHTFAGGCDGACPEVQYAVFPPA